MMSETEGNTDDQLHSLFSTLSDSSYSFAKEEKSNNAKRGSLDVSPMM